MEIFSGGKVPYSELAVRDIPKQLADMDIDWRNHQMMLVGLWNIQSVTLNIPLTQIALFELSYIHGQVKYDVIIMTVGYYVIIGVAYNCVYPRTQTLYQLFMLHAMLFRVQH